ncbi:MAG: transglutaminase domain-containing protein [Candidatus Latescibacterota bacterium]
MDTQTWLYRHDEVQTGRPYGVDVDVDGWLWEGCGSPQQLTGHHLRTAELAHVPLPEAGGRPVYQVFAWQGRLVLTLGEAPFYLVCDPVQRTCVRRAIPVARPIVWYGTRTPAGKLLLYERSQSVVLVLDGPEARPRAVACPFAGQLASGWAEDDGCVYSALEEPARLIRFDVAAERFTGEWPAPWPEATLSGRLTHGGVLYTWDTARGRILPVELATGRWHDPVPAPDHGRLYGFMGGGFGCAGKAYLCLSTYAHPSRLDPRTGKIVIPDGPLTVDGRPPRFLDRLLVFAPETRAFDYLVAPEQPDGIPLLCYHWTDGQRFAVTGMVIPWAEPGVPGEMVGAWIVLQSQPADLEPGFGLPDLRFDRQAHLARYRRGYAAGRSLYLPHAACTPPIRNLCGPATDYPPGREAELVRRAARTDSRAYLLHRAETVTLGADSDAERVRRITGHLQRALYYNPIQVPASSDPVVVLESHDARCSQGVEVTLALLQVLGIPCRAMPLFHHTVAEAYYDGGYHLADALFFGAEQPHREGRVLSVEELQADPYFADAFPQACFAYDPELLQSEDGYWVLGYVFGVWGSEPYWSYYLGVGAPKDHPPTLPLALPAQRLGDRAVRLHWAPSLKVGGGRVEYRVQVFADRQRTRPVLSTTTAATSLEWEVEEPNWMYFVEVQAMDDHRQKMPATWYPAARSNFVLVPREQYGWYGVLDGPGPGA